MSERNRATDPAIKLFGKTIPLPHNTVARERPENKEIEKEEEDKGGGRGEEEDNDDEQQEEAAAAEEETEEKTEKDQGNVDTRGTKDTEQASPVSVDELSEPTSLSSKTNDSSRTHPGCDEEGSAAEDEEQNGAGNPKDKTPKKPDKILPCPRCNSLETKFCYFNNYNINQPRHFCKNCQRYWTAGGTMRNVPVGAGRRKNKSSASRYRHLTVPEALQAAQADPPEAIHGAPLKPNGTVLTFGLDAPLCESMASVLNLADKSLCSFHPRNGFHRVEEQRMAVSLGAENGEELSCGSSVTAPTCSDKNKGNLQDPAVRSGQVFPPQMLPFFGGAPWPYPWNSPHWGSPMPPPPPPPFYPSTLPIPFYPATPYWACSMPGSWRPPWVPPTPAPSSLASGGGGSNSPTLGKHPREGEPLKERNEEADGASKQSSSERCLWIPKTLRIDDPGEAARSSIWATLGIKNDSSSGGGLFNAFQSKQDDRNHTAEASQVLQANPAALSRSRNFHENS